MGPQGSNDTGGTGPGLGFVSISKGREKTGSRAAGLGGGDLHLRGPGAGGAESRGFVKRQARTAGAGGPLQMQVGSAERGWFLGKQ